MTNINKYISGCQLLKSEILGNIERKETKDIHIGANLNEIRNITKKVKMQHNAFGFYLFL